MSAATMPEGHSIHRAARRISSVLTGRRLDHVDARAPDLIRARTAKRLLGASVESVEARGKHLLIHTDAGVTIHSHLRMDGAWHLYRPGERWRRARSRAWLVLGAGDWLAVNFDGPILEVLATDQLSHNEQLRRLGPDILVEPFDDAEYVRRMRRESERQIGDAVLQQHLVAGIGNIYKNEMLFMGRVDPWQRVADLTDDTLIELRRIASRIMADGVLDSRAITYTGPGRAGRWVYSRGGQACRSCGARLLSKPQGADQRTTWWCSTCQMRGGTITD